jgi:hypothetical protein
MAKTPRRQSTNLERPKIASRDELNAFLAKLAKLQTKADDEEETERQEAIRSYLQKFDRQELQKLKSRAFADALKSPSQKLGTAKPPSVGTPRARKTKPAAESKKRPASNKNRSRSGRRGTSR